MTAERAGTINPVQSCMPEHNVDSNYSAETCVYVILGERQRKAQDRKRNTSVAAEDFLVHDSGDGQAVEAVGEGLP